MMWVGLTLALCGLGAAEAAEPSLCARLADEARRLPAAAWARPEPLGRWLRWSSDGAPRHPTAVEEVLSKDPDWRARVGAPEGDVVGVSHLAGTPVYLVESVAGTASCQSVALAEVRAGQAARELALPFTLAPQQLCVGQSARLADVFKRPALVVGGAVGDHDFRYRIAAWTEQGWAPSCALELQLRATLVPARRFCAPGTSVCEVGQAAAWQLAQAYEASRASRAPLDEARFDGGQKPGAAIVAALNPPLADAGAVGDFNLPLPVFGADDRQLDPMQTQFSNADPRRLPVFIDGRWWLAVVGRGGVGWREGDAVLVAFFAPPGRAGDAVAAYQFKVGPAGLREAVAGP